MAQSRRDFLKTASAAGAAAAPARRAPPSGAAAPPPRVGGPEVGALALLAIDAARFARASCADVRGSRTRERSIVTRERRVRRLVDDRTFGVGVRALVGGARGSAASRTTTAAAADPDGGDSQPRRPTDAPPLGRGYEHARLDDIDAARRPVRVSASERRSRGAAEVVPPVEARDFTHPSLSDAVR